MRAAVKKIVRYRANLSPLTDIPGVVSAVKTHRNLSPDTLLDFSLQQLLPFHSLKNIVPASEILADAIMQQQRILVIGDFDTDGATSTALAVSALRMMGAEHVHYLVPNRFKFGYGLTPEIVEAATSYSPDLIITVDNGIASVAGVAAANDRGIKVVVTDHHLPGRELPAAAAIVNPNQVGDEFPSKNLAGVGVIFYVMMAVRAKLRERSWFAHHPEANLAQLLDLLALGTIADVVPLDHNNRILVQQGLWRIRAGECRPGIAALLAYGKRRRSEIQASDLGFIVAPRLNAAGRLEDMSLGIECLLARDEAAATELAARLELLNHERRAIEADMQQDAYSVLQKISFGSNQALPLGLCLYQEHWHQGVTGIVAARLKDRFARPTIAFARVENGELKGSARSVNGVHIRDVLDAIATQNPGLLSRFGGHAMAAGVSLPEENYESFKLAFEKELARYVTADSFANILHSDGELACAALTMETVAALRELGPYGQAFPEPLFDGVFNIIEQRLVGQRHLKLVLQHHEGDELLNAIAFNIDGNEWPNHRVNKLHIAYRLDINEFQQRQNLQLVVEYLHAH